MRFNSVIGRAPASGRVGSGEVEASGRIAECTGRTKELTCSRPAVAAEPARHLPTGLSGSGRLSVMMRTASVLIKISLALCNLIATISLPIDTEGIFAL